VVVFGYIVQTISILTRMASKPHCSYRILGYAIDAFLVASGSARPGISGVQPWDNLA
jgi:hypothetical protein